MRSSWAAILESCKYVEVVKKNLLAILTELMLWVLLLVILNIISRRDDFKLAVLQK